MNLDKYRNERRSPRTEAIKVPQLKPYFADAAEPEFTVRGLSAAEDGQTGPGIGQPFRRCQVTGKLLVHIGRCLCLPQFLVDL